MGACDSGALPLEGAARPLLREVSGLVARLPVGGAPGAGNNGQTRVLYGRFISKDAALYQVLIVGPKNKITDEVVETLLTSFKLP